MSEAWQRKEGKSENGGLNERGRRSLRAKGKDIKRPQPTVSQPGLISRILSALNPFK